jgi:hypothetical protein
MEFESTRSDERLPPQVRQEEPDPFDRDLNANPMAGQNIGSPADDPDEAVATADELKDVHQALADRFDADDLRQIPVLKEGRQLQQGATYIDLRRAQPEEFTATGGMVADSAHWYVQKKRVPYPLWNRLIGVQNPERTDRGNAAGPER